MNSLIILGPQCRQQLPHQTKVLMMISLNLGFKITLGNSSRISKIFKVGLSHELEICGQENAAKYFFSIT